MHQQLLHLVHLLLVHPPTTTDSPTASPTSSPTAAPTPTPSGKVKGTVFEDVNNNGEQDPDEPPIEGVDVVITDSEGNVFTLTTDATGMYMAEVPIGETVIDIDESTLPPGYEQTVGTDPTTVDVPSGGTATDLDGYHFPTEMPTKTPTASPSGSPTASPATHLLPPRPPLLRQPLRLHRLARSRELCLKTSTTTAYKILTSLLSSALSLSLLTKMPNNYPDNGCDWNVHG